MKVRNSLMAVGVLLTAIAAYAATTGDTRPFAKYGVSQVAGWDAGVGAPVCLGIPQQNTIMVRNHPRDGGSSITMYCGFDTSVSPTTGMPVLAGESLSVDVVTIPVFTSSSDGPFDGGTRITAGTPAPQLCCIEAAGAAIGDLHWMIVK